MEGMERDPRSANNLSDEKEPSPKTNYRSAGPNNQKDEPQDPPKRGWIKQEQPKTGEYNLALTERNRLKDLIYWISVCLIALGIIWIILNLIKLVFNLSDSEDNDSSVDMQEEAF